ncbi:MAG: ABC transporter permease [Fimbriiglobus sp.]|nr:ABC transporter permease [Fimbriiglobus sp.]
MPPEAASFMGGGPDLSLLQLAVYAVLGLLLVIFILTLMGIGTLPIFFTALLGLQLGLGAAQNLPDPIGKWSKVGGLVFRNMRRNLLRTALVYVALFVLTGMLTLIYTFVTSLVKLTADKEGQQLVILTEKHSIPSQMPPGHERRLRELLRELDPADRPADLDANIMTWSFIGGSTEKGKPTPQNSLFFFALSPEAITSGMMAEQGLNPEDLGSTNWEELLRVVEVVKEDKRHVVIGEDRLKIMNKRVGDTITVYSTNYPGVSFECIIVGAFPAGGRMGGAAAMRYDYLLSLLDEYEKANGKKHPNADRCLNLVWVRMPSKAAYEKLAGKVNNNTAFTPAAKLETFSAIVGAFTEGLKDILWGMKYIVMPAIVCIMCLVVGITITIGVRERWKEMAVMKVLGFGPGQVMSTVVAEAVLIGLFGGMLATWSMWGGVALVSGWAKGAGGGAAFFASLKVPVEVLWMGPALGLFIGLVGSALPSWSARKVKVSEVFSQVA